MASLTAYQVAFTQVACGKVISGSKRQVTFVVGLASPSRKTELNGVVEEHEITIVWSVFSGKLVISINGREVQFVCGKPMESKFESSWDYRGHLMKVTADLSLKLLHDDDSFQFDLFVNGLSFWKMQHIYELDAAALQKSQGRSVSYPVRPVRCTKPFDTKTIGSFDSKVTNSWSTDSFSETSDEISQDKGTQLASDLTLVSAKQPPSSGEFPDAVNNNGEGWVSVGTYKSNPQAFAIVSNHGCVARGVPRNCMKKEHRCAIRQEWKEHSSYTPKQLIGSPRHLNPSPDSAESPLIMEQLALVESNDNSMAYGNLGK